MAFLRNAWYAAGWAADLDDRPLARTILDEPVVFYRGADGMPVALADMCPHRFAPLSLGKLDGDRIRCPYHGLVFDKDGSCAYNPHGKGLRPASLSVRDYPLCVQDGMIWIWMGDKERIGESAPPSYPFLTRAGMKTLRGYLQVHAHYELVTDNLMDLSHVEFLHPFIGPEGSSAGIQYRAEADGDRISALHRMAGQPNTQLFELLIGEDVKLIDGYANTHWEAPANMCIETKAVSLDQQEQRVAVMPQVHLLTPETERSTHYFWGISRDVQPDNEQLDAMLYAGISKAFEYEDEPMIKAVQERMRDKGLFEMSPALLPMDEASVRARRILERKIKEESAEAPAQVA